MRAARPLRRVSAAEAFVQLSAAERAVLVHLCDGLTNREMAARVRKSESTVKRHVSACLKKFRVPTRVRLMALLR